jgi:hypothetical protein
MREMVFLKRFLWALCAWQVCGFSFYASVYWKEIWGEDDLVRITKLAVCGLVVVGCVALLSRPLGKIAGAIVGLICGLLPSVLMLISISIEKPGFEESAGGAAVAVLLAIPSGVGGTIAGIICAGRKKASVTAQRLITLDLQGGPRGDA